MVALSGGVDSSVAAALMVEAGYETLGVVLNLADGGGPGAADDARAVAERLGIRLWVADRRERFRQEVTQAFAEDYLAGRTPVPCVRCNARFKFACLLECARVFGARAVASGHYARVDTDPETGLRRLRRAADPRKDQTYFLFELCQEQLAALRFPLGGMKKSEVRARARRLGLAAADQAESQEICFVPDGDAAGAVERIRPQAVPGEGEVVDGAGRLLGRHGGVHRFTVGQRRGLGIASQRRLYVTRIDALRNRLVVGDREALLARGARLERVSWIAGEAPRHPVRASVRIRHGHAGAAAVIEAEPGGRARVLFDQRVPAVAPGQAAVFDQGETVLGGGWIAASMR